MIGGDINGIIASQIPSFDAPTLQGLEFQETSTPGVLEMKGSGRQFVKFYTRDIYNPAVAKKLIDTKQDPAGAYEKKLFVRIVTPGDKNEIDTIAEEFHKRQYPRQYQAFKEGKTTIEGKPIDEIEWITAPEATELHHMSIHVIEQLMDASDAACDTLPRGHELREHARNWYKAEYGDRTGAQTKQIAAELNETKDLLAKQQKENEDIRKQLAEMRDMLKAQSGRQKRGEQA